MEQTSQPTEETPTTTAQPDVEDARRASLMHALSSAEYAVSQLRTLPTDVVIRGDLSGQYELRLFYSLNRDGVLEFAGIYDVAVSSEQATYGGTYCEARARVQGVDVVAWAISQAPPAQDEEAPTHPVDEDPIAYALTDEATEAVAP